MYVSAASRLYIMMSAHIFQQRALSFIPGNLFVHEKQHTFKGRLCKRMILRDENNVISIKKEDFLRFMFHSN